MTTLAASWDPHTTQLVLAALIGIALIVALIAALKVHPFISLTVGAGVVGLIAGLPVDNIVEHFTTGVGDTVGGVGMLIALGAMLGKLLADSGGADQLVDTILGRARGRGLPWTMALVASLIGLPMFFEIGLVMLIPVIVLMVHRSGKSLMLVAVPALAGLSVLHGLVPPHPGPLIAIEAFGADLMLTLGLGVLVAIPTVAVAGPVFATYAARWVNVPAPANLVFAGSGGGDTDTNTNTDDGGDDAGAARRPAERRPSFAATLSTMLLPVVLMLGKSIADIALAEDTTARRVLDFVGEPLVALLAAVVVAMVTLGRGAGFGLHRLDRTLGGALPPIAGILLIVAAGGGFNQILVESGIAEAITGMAGDANIDPLILGWLIAVAIRLATGSATVATVTTAGMIAPMATGLDPVHASLLALAVGAGSLFFSHVNDSGFWMVKEYFGLSVGQTLKTWSVMETLIAVVAIVIILPLGWLL